MPQNVSRLKKIVLSLIRLDTADKTKTSLRLTRKQAAWKDDVRMRIPGFTSLGFTSQWPPSAEALAKKRDFSVDAIVCAVVVMSSETEPDPKSKAFKTAEYRTLNEWDS